MTVLTGVVYEMKIRGLGSLRNCAERSGEEDEEKRSKNGSSRNSIKE